MDGRWSNSPEPTPIEVVGTLPESTLHSHTVSIGSKQIRLQMLDPTRITLNSRIDIHAGESQQLDVAARLDNDSECYGWNNETYFHDWRNEDWKLPSGRYLVDVTVTSSGQQWNGLFRLVNDVARSDFRLESALQEDQAKVK